METFLIVCIVFVVLALSQRKEYIRNKWGERVSRKD